jgi:hypothetical protein
MSKILAMRKTRLSVVIFFPLLAACCHVPGSPIPVTRVEQAAWTTDLRKSGFASDPFQIPSSFQAVRQIAFGSNGELVVASDSGPGIKPNDVHAFVLDAKTGKIVREAHWKSNYWPYIFATVEGNYAVVTETGMALYSPGLERVIARGDDTADKISPDGSYLAASKTIPGHGVIYMLNARTLKPPGIEFQDLYAWSIAKDRVVHTGYMNGSHNASVFVTDAHQKFPRYNTSCPDARPNFVTLDVLAIVGCETLDVVSVSGQKVFSAALPGDGFFAAQSRNGKRFAILQQFERPGDPPSLCTERIMVFDIAAQRAIFVTDISELKGAAAGGHSSGVALSPDGSLLAVNSGGIVRIFALPAE